MSTNFAYALPGNASPANDFASDFAKDFTSDFGGLALSLAIFADRPHLRHQLREDAVNAGFRVTEAASLHNLIEGDVQPLAEVVLVDCPAPDGASLAALARLDVRVRQCAAQLIVATTVDALEDVFGCLDQSQPQLLVDPSRADLALALGRASLLAPGRGVREMADDDRMQLMRLAEQVGKIAARLDGIGGESGPGRVASPALAFAAPPVMDESARLLRTPRPPLPDPRLIRKILRQRQQRARFFEAELFADPAWDMLLDLTAARAEHKRVSVTSLCIASGVPPTTALRWIGQMTTLGLFQRIEDTADRRRAFIALSDSAADGMAGYFAAVGLADGAGSADARVFPL